MTFTRKLKMHLIDFQYIYSLKMGFLKTFRNYFQSSDFWSKSCSVLCLGFCHFEYKLLFSFIFGSLTFTKNFKNSFNKCLSYFLSYYVYLKTLINHFRSSLFWLKSFRFLCLICFSFSGIYCFFIFVFFIFTRKFKTR